MYKCKECGAEYKEKPDYCDCGNDEFEGVNTGVNEAGVNKTSRGSNEKEAPVNSAKSQSKEVFNNEKTNEKLSVQPASPPKNNDSPKHNITSALISVDPLSLTIFIICVILSLFVIFFAWNPPESRTLSEEKQDAPIAENIPSIDKIWNNALPVIKQEEPKKEKAVENIIKQVLPVQMQKKTEPPKTTTTKPKTTTVSLKKTTQMTKQITNANTKQQPAVSTQEQAKKAAKEAAKKKAEQERLAAEAEQIKKLQAEQAKKTAEEKVKRETLAKQELINYKAQLRNTIGRKIDFTRVIGDGSCTVSFRIDSSGRLTNRSFSKQSSNNTLNDAVYTAIMATPSFNPPPASYKNEILNINISFYNGNFEISLP